MHQVFKTITGITKGANLIIIHKNLALHRRITTAPTSVKSVSKTPTHIRPAMDLILDCTESDKATFKCFTVFSFRN